MGEIGGWDPCFVNFVYEGGNRRCVRARVREQHWVSARETIRGKKENHENYFLNFYAEK